LYMLATILKSPQAVQATLAIIETFAKIRQLSRSIQERKTGGQVFKFSIFPQKTSTCC
jgi:hypothetical protein